MKTDIDTLMQAHNLDALLVIGPAQHNPTMVYLTGVAHLTYADLIKKRGETPVLFHTAMERDEAAKTGLTTKNIGDYRIEKIYKQVGKNWVKAFVARYKQMFADLGITVGRVGIYGQGEAGETYTLFTALQAALPELELVGEFRDSLLSDAMATKDEAEVERIRRMGQITTGVVGQVADFLTSHHVEEQTLVKTNGDLLTIGEVKNHINLWLTERGVENPHGAIFAIGRDAGVPHSTGTATDPIRLGQTIVFDIFPCEAGGGYFYDLTRTWCLGYAPDEVQALYEDVLSVYRQIMSELQMGTPFKHYQQRACELFKAQGHQTIKENPQTLEGYMHSLGHGLGLHVHEYPFSRSTSDDEERLDPGVVVTIEPGLYYPERGMGMRLEDTVWMRPNGGPEVLAEYPLDLVLPME